MIKPKFLNYEIMFLILILIFAFFIRIYALGVPGLWIDEATSSMASKMILEKGVPVFDSGLLYNRAYVFHYLTAFFMLFGINDFNARLVSLIFGMLTIVLAYFIGKEYSKTAGIISALFMSIFYLEVFFSRQARFYQLFQFMFFLSIYLLYKSGEKKDKENIYLILALACFFIALDSQIAALVLAPFFIVHILVFNKHKYLAIIPAIPLIQKFMPAYSLKSDSADIAANYAESYLAFARKIRYLLILFIPGALVCSLKKLKLTLLMILPSIVMLIGVFSLDTFALRYAYLIVFPLVLYSSILISYLYEKFGNLILIALLFLLIFPSNLVFPSTYINVIKPITQNHGYGDYSTPETDYKSVPLDIKAKLRENTLVSLFSSDVEWYIKKPDYIIPFSMDGRGYDQISWNKTEKGKETGEVVDKYSSALILTDKSELKNPYYVTQDDFSYSKLNPEQRKNFNALLNNCSIFYEDKKRENLKIWECR